MLEKANPIPAPTRAAWRAWVQLSQPARQIFVVRGEGNVVIDIPYDPNIHAAHISAKVSACARTVSTAFSCLSGG